MAIDYKIFVVPLWNFCILYGKIKTQDCFIFHEVHCQVGSYCRIVIHSNFANWHILSKNHDLCNKCVEYHQRIVFVYAGISIYNKLLKALPIICVKIYHGKNLMTNIVLSFTSCYGFLPLT